MITIANSTDTFSSWRDGGTELRRRSTTAANDELEVAVFTRRCGTPGKPALVCVHGFPTSSIDYVALTRELAEEGGAYRFRHWASFRHWAISPTERCSSITAADVSPYRGTALSCSTQFDRPTVLLGCTTAQLSQQHQPRTGVPVMKIVMLIGTGLAAASMALAAPALADSGIQSSSGISVLDTSTSFTSPISANDFANSLESQLASVPSCGSCGLWTRGAPLPSV